ncbi:MAG: TRAP transporter substrate-binding protein DctP [Leucobacter sp.]|nr:TRAP transporter substrate-binding protein DctP [Leucobacter sp.]
MAHHAGSGGVQAQEMEAYMEAVSAATDYNIDVTYYHDAELCPPNEQAMCAADGRIDITQVLPTYHPGEFPMSTVGSLGFLDIPDAAGLALMDLWGSDDAVKAEWESQNLVPLFPISVGDYTLGVNGALESFDDMSGLRVRAIGASAASLASVGADPSALAAPEIYESMQRGVLDGWSIPIDYALTQGFEEVTSHIYDIGLGPALTSMFAINADKWASLPEDLQQTFLEVADDFAVEAWDTYMVPTIQDLCVDAKSHLEYVGVLEDGREDFMATGLEITTKDWIDNVAGNKVDDPQELVDRYRGKVDDWEAKLSDGFVSTAAACGSVL